MPNRHFYTLESMSSGPISEKSNGKIDRNAQNIDFRPKNAP